MRIPLLMSSQLPSHVSYNSVWWKTIGFVIVDFLFYVIFLGCTYSQQSGLHQTTVHLCVALSMLQKLKVWIESP